MKEKSILLFLAILMTIGILPANAFDQYESMNVGETKTFYFPSEVTSRTGLMYDYNCTSDHINNAEVVSYTKSSVTVKALAYIQTRVNIRFDYWWMENGYGRHDTHMVHIDLNDNSSPNNDPDYNPNKYSVDYGCWGNITIEVGETRRLYSQYNITDWEKVHSMVWSDVQSLGCEVISEGGAECTIKGLFPMINDKIYCLVNYGNNSFKAYYNINVIASTKETLALSASTAGGKIKKGEQVYLTASVSGSDIYYTLDGTWPTTSSTKYPSSGITIDESCELRAFATKRGYNDSPVMSWVYSVDVPKITTTITDVVAGSSHSLIIDKNGTLWAFGNNSSGELGDGTMKNRQSPVKIMDDVLSVAAGNSHTMIIKKDGSLWACGYNKYGQLGIGSSQWEVKEPAKVMDHVVSVAAGNDFSLIVKDDGSLWTCGFNLYGQLGDGSTTNRNTLTKIMDDVASVAAGEFHSLILKKDGSLWACGRNNNGQLGDGTNEDKNYPVKITEDVSSIAAGSYHTMVIKNDGSLWTCGLNGNGQLGFKLNFAALSHYSKPDLTKIMDGVAFVGCNKGGVTQIIKTDGSYWACGYNGDDNLGGGPTSGEISTPFKVIDDASRITSGSAFTLLVKKDGSLWACGKNGSGQLGDGTTTDRHSFVKIVEGEESPQSINSTLVKLESNSSIFSLSGQRLAAPRKGINIVGGKKVIVK